MAGKKKATLRDVAVAAGVAESTASRALAGSPLISDETRSLIEETANSLGYRPRRKANPAQEDSRKKGVIGVVVASLGNSFYPFLVDRVHGELNALGYDMVLIIDEFSNSRGSRNIRSIINNSLDGVIFMTSTIQSDAVEFLVEQEIPTVLAIRSNQRKNVDVIESDNTLAGAQAMQHLTTLGHRDIGLLMGPRDTSTAHQRFAGACDELVRRGVSHHPAFVYWGDFTHESGYSAMARLWQGKRKPTAVFCANDVIAIGAMDACLKLGLKVPDDISIIGVDDAPMSSWSMVSLTTIRQNIEDIGSRAARRIVERILSPSDLEPLNEIYPTSLVQRTSTSKPRT